MRLIANAMNEESIEFILQHDRPEEASDIAKRRAHGFVYGECKVSSYDSHRDAFDDLANKSRNVTFELDRGRVA